MQTRACQNCKKDFTIAEEDFSFYQKIDVPAPTFCPECRLRRRMSWRNERSLHKKKCSAPGHTEEVITMYSPERPHVVFDNQFWWSDSWDALDYGAEYDFSIPFFKQFSDLLERTPLAALSTLNSVNSEYTNFVDGNKNCYLIFGSGWSENVRYANKVMSCKDSQDLLMCNKCELSYECEGCNDSHHLLYSRNSKNCTDSYLLYNCRNCLNCFGCANLVSKSYCMWNVQYSREEYFAKLAELGLDSYANVEQLKERFIREIYLPAVHRFANIFNSVDSTGDNITHAKNAKNCFDVFDSIEDSKYMYSGLKSKDTYDGNGIYDHTLSYECVDGNSGQMNLGTVTVYDSMNTKYAFNCHNCKDCFGCTGLRNKRYCILNKQYMKEEYEELVPKILAQMDTVPYVDSAGCEYRYGEFFPTDISPFYYNETIAQEYFPAEEGVPGGYNLKTKDARGYKITKGAGDLPDSIKDVADDIVGDTVSCLHSEQGEHSSSCDFACTEAFKVTVEDLQFHKQLGVPLPRLCPNCRHYTRLKRRNPLMLWYRDCMCEQSSHNHSGKCSNEFETAYAPDRPEIIYCESCYQKEVM
jgi:hypothetical protein